eukprot:gb/GECH01000530.1/.p1 GENE.gb/GECH01000530.1/~~gb/GECH01000530.1/.p1  ORF type:complete len:355 (+),score=72.86 gb/GECH01000530.1/:1-1065(+)
MPEASSSPPPLYLYAYQAGFDLPSADPECISAETYLRMAGIEFNKVTSGSPLMSPTHNLPLLKQGSVAEGGARNIVEHLKRRQIDLDAHLSARERMESEAFISLILEKLQHCIMYNWWSEDDNYGQVTSHTSFYTMSWISRLYMIPMQRSRITSRLQRAGFLSHRRRYAQDALREVLRALSLLLGDGPYFYGEHPSTLDAFAYGHLACLIYPKLPVDAMQRCVRDEFPSLASFCDRVTEAVFTTEFHPQHRLSTPPPRSRPNHDADSTRRDGKEETAKEREFRRGSQRFLFFSGVSIAAYFLLLYGRVISVVVRSLSSGDEEEGIDGDDDEYEYEYIDIDDDGNNDDDQSEYIE